MEKLKKRIVIPESQQARRQEKSLSKEEAERLGEALGKVIGEFIQGVGSDLHGALQVPTGRLTMERRREGHS